MTGTIGGDIAEYAELPDLSELENMKGVLESKLTVEKASEYDINRQEIDERKFRWMMNENAIAQ